ncbi:hypothetical protein FAEPRAM212_03124 [Faecalibacterium prausnitzii M21/2]|uniref:Uncharacterized protein n=1 Tax=Faecalibacterium prausnitzii M21/2 TaxID=411485 RepID=A8SGP5_9FIRM|nr:hypothetical protein FAEPRAM212_03124 [Faecalibacterium prausnitzii M21/2]
MCLAAPFLFVHISFSFFNSFYITERIFRCQPTFCKKI